MVKECRNFSDKQSNLLQRLEKLYVQVMDKGDAESAGKIRDLQEKLKRGKADFTFCGHFSAGKSSLVNRLCGASILPSSPIPTSANVVLVENGEEGVTIERPGEEGLETVVTTVDKLDEACRDGAAIRRVYIRYPVPLLGDGARLLDTPGVDSTDDAHRQATEDALHLADAVFYVMDYNHVLSEMNFAYIRKLAELGKPLFLIVNQIDKHRHTELDFADFRTRVQETLQDWQVEPAALLFISLKKPEDPNNEWPCLENLLERLVQESGALLTRGIIRAVHQIIAEHEQWLREQEADRRMQLEEMLDEQDTSYTSELSSDVAPDQVPSAHEGLAAADGTTVTGPSAVTNEIHMAADDQSVAQEQSYASGRSAAEELERWRKAWEQLGEPAKQELQRILDQANVIPAPSRDLAHHYLQSRKSGFRVGFFFSERKTVAEQERRLSAWHEEVVRQADAHIRWHVVDYCKGLIGVWNLDSDTLEQCEAIMGRIHFEITADWLASLVQDGHFDDAYTLQYARTVADQLKLGYRRLLWDSLDEIARVLKPVCEQRVAELERLRQLEQRRASAKQQLNEMEQILYTHIETLHKVLDDVKSQMEWSVTDITGTVVEQLKQFRESGGTGMGRRVEAGAGTCTGTGFGSESGTGTGMGRRVEAGAGTGTGTGFGSESGTGTGMGRRVETGAGTGMSTGSGSESGTGTGTGTGSGSESGAGTGMGRRVETGAGTGMGTGFGSESGTGTGMGTGTGTKMGAAVGTEADERPIQTESNTNERPENRSIHDAAGAIINQDTSRSIIPFQMDGENSSQTKLQQTASRLRQAGKILEPMPMFSGFVRTLYDRAERLDKNQYTIALFGAFSAGKSSFANALLHTRVLPVSPNPTTAAINSVMPMTADDGHGQAKLHYKTRSAMVADIRLSMERLHLTTPAEDEELVALLERTDLRKASAGASPGAKVHVAFLQAVRSGWSQFQARLGSSEKVDLQGYRRAVADETQACFLESVDLYVDSAFASQGMILVDTPGADSINARHTDVAFNYIKNADAILFVTYYNHAFSHADREFLLQLGRVKDMFALNKMFFIVNAADLASDEEELEQVVDYVRQNLEQFGIREPRIFPVSSMQAIEGLEQGDGQAYAQSGLPAFEKQFYHFVHHELAEMSLRGAKAELEGAREALAEWIRAMKNAQTNRDALLRQLKEGLQSAANLLGEGVARRNVEELHKEIQELIYYVAQRVSYRYGEFYNLAFNPSSFADSTRSDREILTGAYEELLQYFTFDLGQELRATTLRVEACIDRMLTAIYKDWSSQLNGWLQGFKAPQRTGVTWESAPCDVALEESQNEWRMVRSMYRGNRHFFEQDGKQALKNALEPSLAERIRQVAEDGQRTFIDHYEQKFREAVAAMAGELEQAARTYAETMQEALRGDESVTVYEERLAALDDIV